MNSKQIADTTNIYTPGDQLEVPLISHMINGDVDLVDYIWNVYVNDLQFIKNKIQRNVWAKSVVFVGFGASDSAALTQLYHAYEQCENRNNIDYKKCAVFLVKSDNVTPIKVFCVSPKTSAGRLVTVRMIKHVLTNGVLNINTKSKTDISLINCTAISGNLNILTKLLDYGIKPNLQELLGFALENTRLSFLKMLYTNSLIKMYAGIWKPFDIFKKLIKTDSWELFEYVVENALVEKGLTWNQILSQPYSPNYSNNLESTIFGYLLSRNCINIATNCLKYEHFDIGNISNLLQHPVQNLTISEESKDLALLMISIEPRHIVQILHNRLEVLTLDEVIGLFKKYPWIKQFYSQTLFRFSHHIDNLLKSEQFDKLKLLLQIGYNCMDDDMVYKILKSIMWACNDNIEMFKYVLLLKPSFDLAALPIGKKEDLIISAIDFRNPRICRFLVLQLDYNLNNIGDDVLLLPIRARHPNNMAKLNRIYRTLLQLGNNYNTLDYLTLLRCAIESNNFYGTKLMLELGADISIPDRYSGNLPIHYARSLEIFRLLNTWTTTSYVNSKNYSLDTPLHFVMRHQPSEATHNLITYILENGGNINAKNKDGISPVFIKSNRESVALILKYNPDLYLTCPYYNVPLLFSALEEGNECVGETIFRDKNSKFRLYLDQQCSGIDHKRFILRTFHSNSIISQLLLELPNLNVFIYDIRGNSCLHLAVAAGNHQVLEKLIERGLSLEKRNKVEDTVLLVYCKNITDCVRCGTNDLIQKLFKYNPVVNVRNKMGMTPILYATQYDKNGEFILELLARGANLSDRDKTGKMAYDYLTDELKMGLKFLLPNSQLHKFWRS